MGIGHDLHVCAEKQFDDRKGETALFVNVIFALAF